MNYLQRNAYRPCLTPRIFSLMLGTVFALSFAQTYAEKAPPMPTVTVTAEEDVYTFLPPNNGSGPLWSFGCTSIVRMGARVVVSQMETGQDVPPLCNTRWRLLSRENGAWRAFAEAEGYRQREPCPLAITSDKTLFLNVNDSQTPAGSHYLECKPHLLRFDLAEKEPKGTPLVPRWDGATHFTDHSYRGFSADPAGRLLLMLNINAETGMQHWCLLTETGETLANGGITFPIRACYPHVALEKGAAHVLAISDIVEPIEEWRKYKFEQTQRTWDYVFRILYYTWTPDIRKQAFAPPIEAANVEATGGHISNQDLWIAPDGAAYVMYTEAEVQSALMRDKFFPGKSIIPSLRLAVIKDGKIVSRRTLVEGQEGRIAVHARFQVTPEGAVYAVVYMAGQETYNALLPVYPERELQETRIPLKNPFSSFLLATTRAGNAPSRTVDMLGFRGKSDTISYAQIEIGTSQQERSRASNP